MQRRAEFRPFSWINDLYQRGQLDLSPPYQRRSVWSERYKVDFITTVLMNYPCPAVFLYEEIRADGSFLYKVVDGKQRISTLLSFVSGEIGVGEDYPREDYRGSSFERLPQEAKIGVWRYYFAVEFIEQENETVINDIFNRINKNVAKLTPQELRHAKFSGVFISEMEVLSEYMDERLGLNFPKISNQSRRQMKDVENAILLALFIERGERSHSQADLDEVCGEREDEWDLREDVSARFRAVTDYIGNLLDLDEENILASSRLKNQADFYSLFAALCELERASELPEVQVANENLQRWVQDLSDYSRALAAEEDVDERAGRDFSSYLQAARAASNDPGPRRRRIDILKRAVMGA